MSKKKNSVAVVLTERLTLAESLAKSLGVKPVSAKIGNFADSESVIEFKEIDQIKSRLVFLVNKFDFKKVGINEQLIGQLLLAAQLKIYGAAKIVAVFPYLPYNRQSKDSYNENVGPFQAVGSFFKSAGVDHVISCELHEKMCQDIFAVPLHQVNLLEIFCEKILKENFSDYDLKDVCFVSPDDGGVGRVERVSKKLGVSTAFVSKKRIAFDQSVATDLSGDIKGKTVILVDDIVDTANTVVNAAQMVKDGGAKEIFGCFCHPVLSGGAIYRLKNSFMEKIFVCNTIPLGKDKLLSKIEVVDFDDEIKKYVLELV